MPDLGSTDAGELDAAVAALAAGGLVVFPTDTVFGLAARPDVEGATDAIFEAKQRPRSLTLPILVADGTSAWEVAERDGRAARLAAAHWPGPLTLVLRRTAQSSGWQLGDEGGTVGVRVPDHPIALELLRRTGPLAVTSANRSGEPTPDDCAGVRSALGDAVAVYLCAGSAPRGTASTVADLTGAEARVLREGALPSAELLAMLDRGAPKALE